MFVYKIHKTKFYVKMYEKNSIFSIVIFDVMLFYVNSNLFIFSKFIII